MSFLSKSLHDLAAGEVEDWAKYSVGYIKRHIGTPLTPDAADKAVTDIEAVKFTVQRAAEAFLVAKLGPLGGPMAAHVADQAIGAIAGVVESAARALEAQPPAK